MKCTGLIPHIGQCREDAEYLILFGCLNLHIGERPYCNIHAGEWLGAFDNKKWLCSCPLKLEEFQVIYTRQIRPAYLDHLNYTPS